MIIEQLTTTRHVAVDRFYRTLYESLLDPRLITTSKHALYLNLLFRAMRADSDQNRVKAFAKRLLQVLALHEPPFICGVLYMMHELEKVHPGLRTIYTEGERTADDDEEVFQDADKIMEGMAEAPKTNVAATECLYDGRKRDPLHSHAEESCLWEIVSCGNSLRETRLTMELPDSILGTLSSLCRPVWQMSS